MAYNWEIILFGLLNYVPYIFFIAAPFYTERRFSKCATLLAVAAAAVLAVAVQFLIARGMEYSIGALVNTVVNGLIILLLIQDWYGKPFMTLLIIQNTGILLDNIAKYTETIFFMKTHSCTINGRIPFFWLCSRYLLFFYCMCI